MTNRDARPAGSDRSATDPWVACLQDIASGDERALRRLYDAFAPRLMGLAVRILGRMGEAEEVLHDAMLQIWKCAGRYDHRRASPESWIFLIVRRKCIDRLRRRRAQVPLATLWEGDSADNLVDFSPGPSESLDEDPSIRRLRALPARQREVLELAFFDGYTQVEIANLKGRPLGTVKSDIRRALRRLRQGGASHV